MRSILNAIVYRTPVPVIIVATLATAGLLGALIGFAGQAFSGNVSVTGMFIIGVAASAVTFVTHRVVSLFLRS